MRPEWRTYWAHARRYLWNLPLGIPIALVPFLINLERHRADGTVRVALTVSIIYGVAIPLAISAWYLSVFAALTYARRGLRFRPSLALHALCGVGGMVTGIWASALLKRSLLGLPSPLGTTFSSLAFACLVAALFVFYHAHRLAKEEALELRAAAAEANYRALEQQMRPHFLFNALNSLAELIESERGAAAGVAHTLSDLYRQVLANSKSKTATLDSELEIARRYLEVERVRFGRRLTFAIAEAGEARELHVPSLIVQTLVENAIKHGIAPSVEGGHVEVEIEEAPGGLRRISVANTGAPYADGGTGTGLENTRARLDLLYGDRHGFAVGADAAGRTVASFCVTGERLD
jgi:signal transduction histidine kinase